jgi:hypothetical protein
MDDHQPAGTTNLELIEIFAQAFIIETRPTQANRHSPGGQNGRQIDGSTL